MSLGEMVETAQDTTPNDGSMGETPNEVTNNAEGRDTPSISDPDWYWSDGIKGEGKPPEGYNSSKYKSVAEQAKAQTELEKKFGGFTGSPKDGYEIELSEDLIQRGFELQDDDPMLEKAVAFAKSTEMNNESFNELVNLYGEIRSYEKEMEAEAEANWEKEQMRLVGNDAQSQLKDLFDWGKTNLSPSEYKYLNEIDFSAGNLKLLQSLIAKTQEGRLSADDTSAVVGDLEKTIEKMYFEKDEFGARRLQSDTQFAGEYEQKKLELKRLRGEIVR